MNILSPADKNECERCGKVLDESFGVDPDYCEDCRLVLDRRQVRK